MNIRSNTLIALTGVLVLSAVAVMAEESGEGPYNPGQTADFIDTMPGYPSLAYMNVFTYYGGSAGGSQEIPISGMLALGLKANSYSDSSVLVWETPLKVFGGYYNIFASIPYTWLTVSGDVQKNGKTVHSSDSVNGIGDVYFSPATIGWTNGDFKWDGRFGIYAPTGGFDKTSLANTGLGYWSFEPEVTFSWFSSKIGTEFSVFAGVDFNTENPDTSYTTGDIFHIDFTLSQHLPMPLLGGYVGVGANGFWYKQFTGDTGAGAALGGFLAEQIGVGPVVSYIRKIGKTELAIDVKWLPQLDVQNMMKGNYVWVKAALVF